MADKVPNLVNQSKPPKGPTVIDPTVKGPHGSNGPTEIAHKAPVASFAPTWMTEIENYLTSNGWVKLGTSDRGVSIWQDPLGTNLTGEKKPTVRLPIQGGGEEQIYQGVLPPVAWNYNSEDAMMVQRQRDYNSQSLVALIKVKERELKDLREKLAKREEVVV